VLLLLRRRLRTGATIQTVSALLLHLVQTCPADLASQVRKKIAKQVSPDVAVTMGGADADMDDDLGLGARLLNQAEGQAGGDDEEDTLVRPCTAPPSRSLREERTDAVLRSPLCRSC